MASAVARNAMLEPARGQIAGLGETPPFHRSALNAVYSVAEYVAQPLGMVLAAPYLIEHLGLSQFGIWMLVSAVIGSMSLLSSGFGDATVKYVSTYRGRNDPKGVRRVIRGTLAINTILGGLLATAIWSGSSYAAHHIFKIEPVFYHTTTRALQLGGLVMFVRSLESVFANTLRAHEHYGPSVRLNVLIRATIILASVLLSGLAFGVVAILTATLLLAVVGMTLQALAVRRLIPVRLLPALDATTLYEIMSFGVFSWLQSLSAIVFGYGDRLIVASMLGTVPLAYYAVCIQAAQPIHGVVAASFNFLFPHLSSRHEAGEVAGPARVYRLASAVNILLACLMTIPLSLFAKPLLRIWMGTEFASHSYLLLASIAIAFGLMSINVVPHYALLALGRVRFISLLNLSCGVLLFALIFLLVSRIGLLGAGFGRILYAAILAVVYITTARSAFGRNSERLTRDEAWQSL